MPVDARARHGAAAAWIEGFLGPAYGPHGGHKLVDAGDLRILGGASALREIESISVEAQPYRRLIESVEAMVGDQATGTALLAAGLVRRAADDWHPSVLQGFALARRQLLASLDAWAAPTPVGEVFGEEGATIASGLRPGDDLDLIAIESVDTMELAWSRDIRVRPDRPLEGPAKLGLMQGSFGPKGRATTMVQHGTGAEAAWEKHAASRFQGIDLLVCTGTITESLLGRLHDAGTRTWLDAPLDAVKRLAASTGAEPTVGPPVEEARADVHVRRDRSEYWIAGEGPQTLLAPRQTETGQRQQDHRLEALLRAVGAYVQEPRAVTGWQGRGAEALRRIADHAPGRAPLGVRMVADALEGLAERLRENAGLPYGAAAPSIPDSLPAVRYAVGAALDTAVAILRIDASHERTSSSAERLRGGTGPIGSPRGMPGDVPPLM